MYKKIAIFPIDYNTVTFARYAHLGRYEPIALIVPSLNIFSGSDISKLDGGSKTNILLHSDYKSNILKSDVIYFTDSNLMHNENIYHELINFAKQFNKEIIISKSLKTRLKIEDVKINEYDIEQILLNIDFSSPKILPIDVPIISIFTIGDGCAQAQTEFSIKNYFSDKGYRAVLIGSQEYSNIIGSINMPSFVFDDNITINKKIFMFNYIIREISRKEEPDLILIGVPNPITKYNDEITNNFGIIPFIIQNAIKSDIGIVNLYYEEYVYEYFDEISQFCKYRFDIEAKYFSISNIKVQKNDMGNELEYLYLDTEFVRINLDKKIGKNKYTIFPSYDESEMLEAYQNIENELLSNPLIV